MYIPVILILVAMTIYLVWKLMVPAKQKKPEQQKFSIGKHRNKEINDDDEE